MTQNDYDYDRETYVENDYGIYWIVDRVESIDGNAPAYHAQVVAHTSSSSLISELVVLPTDSDEFTELSDRQAADRSAEYDHYPLWLPHQVDDEDEVEVGGDDHGDGIGGSDGDESDRDETETEQSSFSAFAGEAEE